MLKDVTLGQFFPGQTPIHKLDPRTKLVLVIVYIVALFLAKWFVSYVVIAAFLAIVIAMSKIRLKVVLKNLKPLLFIIILTALLNLFYGQGGTNCAVLDLQNHKIRHSERRFHGASHFPARGRNIYVNLYNLADRADGRAGKSAVSAQKAARAGA